MGGHEYAETITDPQPDSGWFDAADNVSGGEIGDKCVWGGGNWGGSDPDGNVTLPTGTFAMQSLWSNAAGACVMSGPSGPPLPTVTGVSPSQGPAAGGTAVTVTGTNLTGGTVAFGSHAAAGVSCTATACRATSPAGTGTVHVSVTTTGGTSATSRADQFSYTTAPSGPIIGYRDWCVADVGVLTRNGNPAALGSCNGTPAQTWTVSPNGTLAVAGKCMTALSAANGARIQVTSCTGSSGQAWSSRPNGEVVNPHSGRCLSFPGSAPSNGLRLTLATCTDGVNQRWQLP